jgi:hypothetical protein
MQVSAIRARFDVSRQLGATINFCRCFRHDCSKEASAHWQQGNDYEESVIVESREGATLGVPVISI